MFFAGQLSVVHHYLCMGQAKLPPNTGNPIDVAADVFFKTVPIANTRIMKKRHNMNLTTENPTYAARRCAHFLFKTTD